MRVLQRGGVVQMPALMVIGLWIVLQLFSGIGSISNAANTGGVAFAWPTLAGSPRAVC